MRGEEDTALRLLADAHRESTARLEATIASLADEVRGYRKELNGRLRELEHKDAARSAREETEADIDAKRVTRRDIYVPLFVAQVVPLLAAAVAVLAYVKG